MEQAKERDPKSGENSGRSRKLKSWGGGQPQLGVKGASKERALWRNVCWVFMSKTGDLCLHSMKTLHFTSH